jgi:sugar phosphate isomerase/epimerase
MKAGGAHLTYCSNIHAGERWSDVRAALEHALPKVRAGVGHRGPFGIGLRLSDQAARALEREEHLGAFREWLAAGEYYVPTINGFPFGAFHGTRVKERVYQPDWRSPDRVAYSNRLARLLAVLAADAGLGFASVSTVPGAFRADIRCPADEEAVAAGVLDHAACLKMLAEETGVTVALALEPEPACQLETVDDAIRFFTGCLLNRTQLAAAARRTGVALGSDTVRAHVGVCLDACHMAVEFEDPATAVARLFAEGIRIPKAQLSAALRVVRQNGRPSPRAVLDRFAEDTYLHQVVTSRAAGLTRYVDLPEALGAADDQGAIDEEWRVHFHVPIFLPSMGAFDTTQSSLVSLIQVLQRTSATPCYEVETYTWDVLPAEYRTTDVSEAIARELGWVREVLDGGSQRGFARGFVTGGSRSARGFSSKNVNERLPA